VKKQIERIVQVVTERHVPLTEKTCPQCGKKFMGVKIQQYCSKPCAKKAAYQRNPDIYRESRMRSYRKKQAEKQIAGKQ
jgi:hypothetical protein